jgi:hypothetical protein
MDVILNVPDVATSVLEDVKKIVKGDAMMHVYADVFLNVKTIALMNV